MTFCLSHRLFESYASINMRTYNQRGSYCSLSPDRPGRISANVTGI